MTRKRTFSLPDDVSADLDRLAPQNASAFVADAVRAKIDQITAAHRIREAYGEPDPSAYAYWLERLAPVSPDQQTS